MKRNCVLSYVTAKLIYGSDGPVFITAGKFRNILTRVTWVPVTMAWRVFWLQIWR